MDLEAVDFWFVEVDFWREDDGFGVVLQKDVGQRGAEKCAIDVDGAELRQVALLALGAEDLESAYSEGVAQPHWQGFLSVAESAGAVAEDSLQELVIDFSEACGRARKSFVDQAVQIRRLLVRLHEVLVVQVLFSWRVRGKNHLLELEKLFFRKTC